MSRSVRSGRVALVVLGVAALSFGLQQLLTGGNSTRLTSSLPWLIGVLVVHDGVLAPAAALAGWMLTRVARGRWARAVPAVGVGAYLAVVLVLLALPALLSPGVTDNRTVLPRDYRTGLGILLAADLAITVVLASVAVRRHGGPAARPGNPPRGHLLAPTLTPPLAPIPAGGPAGPTSVDPAAPAEAIALVGPLAGRDPAVVVDPLEPGPPDGSSSNDLRVGDVPAGPRYPQPADLSTGDGAPAEGDTTTTADDPAGTAAGEPQ